MLVGCLGLLIASGFVSEVPPLLSSRLSSTNEVRGVFVQTKQTPEGGSYVMSGDFRVRPGVDFEWRTKLPFETRFYATPTNYVYSNEDETVVRGLDQLPSGIRLPATADEGFGRFFQLFDALYKEADGRFYVKAKPKSAELRRVLERVDAEGTLDDWVLTATFVNRTRFSVRFNTGGKR